MKKRISALLLAFVMLLTLAVSAFAQSIALTADKAAVKAGEDVAVTLSFDEALENVSGLALHLHFNSDLFTFKSSETFDDSAVVLKSVKGTAPRQYKVINWASLKGIGTIQAGRFVTCTFTAREDIADVSAAEFTASVDMSNTTMAPGNADPVYPDSKLSVSVLPASVTYAVSASAVSPAVAVGEDVQVSLKVDGAAAYNAYFLELTYDSNILAYKSVNTDASVQDDNGTLKLAGYGADKTCGADNIVLTFTARSIGEANVTVTSAKVDAKANAAEKDAPPAALLSPTAAVTVGGYMVTLPDAFTGDGTAAPGKDYTFTAKDASRKYDFTGSTMGGSAVDVTDNGDGTYTVKNITGTLIILATEKVGKVKISLTNSTAATVVGLTDGQEVGPGKALSFMVIDMSGKTPLVTVNGVLLEPVNSQMGRLNFSIPAETVTGSVLNIAVSYAQAPSYTVNASEYVKLDGKSIFLITASGDVAEGKVLSYGENQMYWSDKYNAYAWLVISDKTLDEVSSNASAQVTAVTGTRAAIAYTGDVNLTQHTDINDAQLVWNMYNAQYADFQSVSVRKFLEADMTGDGKVDTADAAAITALLFR